MLHAGYRRPCTGTAFMSIVYTVDGGQIWVDPIMSAAVLAITGSTTAAAAAMANAVKASGAIIRLDPEEFSKVLSRTTEPLIVISPSGFKKRKTQYLLSWKGFVFHCISTEQMSFPKGAEIIAAKKIWIPS